MTDWIIKLKSLLIAFLGTHDDKYVVTHDGKKILLWDRSWGTTAKAATSWNNPNKSPTTWATRSKA